MKTVKYSFITSHDWDVDHPECVKPLLDENYYPYISLVKESTAIRKGAIFLKCPAHTDFLKNTFIFCAPFDLTLDVEVHDQGMSKIYCENISQEVFEKIVDLRFVYDHERGIDPYPIIGLDWLNTFTCDKSLMLQVFPAFMHKNDFTDKTTLLPGQYDISQWIRPVELVFEVRSNKEKIVIKKGDPIAYFKFHTEESIKLEEQPTPWKEIHMCDDIKSANRFRPLKERYKEFAKAKGCPYDHKS